MRWMIVAVLCLQAAAQQAPPPASASACQCDTARPETLKERNCSLCAEAEKHSGEPHFIVRDNNPRKPNRWLLLPTRHLPSNHPLQDMTPAERTLLWTVAIAKGKELFGDDWAIAYNGPQVRTQCHTHIHIGKFITVAELPNFRIVNRIADIPAPKDAGVWVHQVHGKLHVHAGEQITETVLAR
jgi:CDP-diacylglycerol pyrophosphatase